MRKLLDVINSLKELRRYKNNGGADIVFYCSNPVDEIWIRSTLSECVKRQIKCSLIVTGSPRKITEQNTEGLKPYYIHLRFLNQLACKILVTASSGIQRTWMPVEAKYRIHMPHSLASLHMIYPEDAFDGYNVIFACGKHHIDEIHELDRIRNIRQRIIFPVGYGKSDILEAESAKTLSGIEDNPKHIVIAPSWGEGNILHAIGENLIECLLGNNYIVTLRPHPAFLIDDPDRNLSKMQSIFAHDTRFAIEDPREENQSLFLSDLMISDYSGIAFEYSFHRERPVLFIDVKRKVVNPNWEKIMTAPIEISLREKIGILVSPEVDKVSHGVEKLLSNTKKYNEEIVRAKEKYLFNLGKCDIAAADQIEKLMAQT